MSEVDPTAASALTRELGRFSTAVLADAMGGENVLPHSISAVAISGSVAGPAYTVRMVAGDNLALHVAVTRARPGDVIVAACPEENPFGVWGGILSFAAQKAGIAAVVLEGCVRDRRDLEASDVAVFARGVFIRKSAKHDPGQHQLPVSIGESRVGPGDIVVGDADGIVVVAQDQAASVLDRAIEIERKEVVIIDGLKEGRTTLDLLGLDVRESTSGSVEES